MDLSTLTIKEARRALDVKEYSALDLTNAYLDAIAGKDKEIHAYLEVWADSAREEAKAADAVIAKGGSQPLTGIPLAIKDNMLIEGRRVSSGSKILENYVASYDATVIRKLKEQNVVFLGRTNMDEFALGSSTENSAYGPTKNPHDTSRVPGGTSGGSTAAVAAGMALGALGSDTGGSIRQPSALCGVVGIKPTYGAVSRFGLIAAASSLDQIGSIGKTVADTKVILDSIQGHDANDSTSLPDSFFANKKPVRKVLGVPRAFLGKGMEPDMLAAFENSLTALSQKGYTLVDIELPALDYALAVYYIINPAEVSTNLARLDGIRYGLSVPADTIAEVYSKTRAQGFGTETRRRILTGTFVLSAGYADAYYRKARAVRELIRADFAKAFESVDAIALPVSPIAPWKFGEKADPVAMYAADIFTVPVSLAGVPAISVPGGTVERDGKKLPVGFQLIAPHGGEETLFAIGKDIENSS
ncbi:glutaminyl-tRNA synthase (glutamine-hydrolyzing) subunit A [Candidatus Kaiserbacteria bacterium RIFCSPHIGHO2_02_FULL_55_25]|uniref:Glutamyl-tRNA(Gln) amidotransferase subunit A n=1 Tax=Candidatus Kaiserbacteria bacterium RIFCSPHIGHO2_02_FULL_55_25 TaxID=1798498 RepID=A0A1F6E4C6_9BACT|nr:MAG: glutaminyl-tRNA synthase (glutamine-hydrolyzing) subunit A [Candidatus Kaiserbacteria bacterium RIFCSPHIGHO2_01_FULL_55_79]OGG68496.1 MAG: glutaminyl-tRNA synthase (glutamine-hydrolyzing) subunit A [Candidatus Kaiserbacteria bacterium RIFCSPHIGHO2_02_FULL_55_25]OGG82780.1 MAG: glutaminyl-tRNA synthase (glutamine-hydrolyzing) subunit A [Candidatus Kaiserbacteria bacterium RIFCSPLOWO2_01_FULL_55_25]